MKDSFLSRVEELTYFSKILVAQSAALKWTLAAAAAVLEYVLPNPIHQKLAVTALIFVGLDMVTGLAAAWHSKNPIQSAKMGRTFTKLIGYCSAILVFSLAGAAISGFDAYREGTLSAILTLIAVTEGTSILENVNKLGIKLPTKVLRLFQEKFAGLEDAAPDAKTKGGD